MLARRVVQGFYAEFPLCLQFCLQLNFLLRYYFFHYTNKYVTERVHFTECEIF